MADPLHLRVLTDSGLALEDSAVSIIAPGAEGYFGILRDHAPLLAALRPGRLTWRSSSGQTRTMQIGEGFLEVVKNRVTLLTSQLDAAPAKPGADHGRASH